MRCVLRAFLPPFFEPSSCRRKAQASQERDQKPEFWRSQRPKARLCLSVGPRVALSPVLVRSSFFSCFSPSDRLPPLRSPPCNCCPRFPLRQAPCFTPCTPAYLLLLEYANTRYPVHEHGCTALWPLQFPRPRRSIDEEEKLSMKKGQARLSLRIRQPATKLLRRFGSVERYQPGNSSTHDTYSPSVELSLPTVANHI